MAITQDFAPLAVGAIVVGVLASLLSGMLDCLVFFKENLPAK